MVGSRNLTTAETSEAMASSSSEVTVLLRLWSAGDERAREQLIPLMYGALRELAHRRRGGAPVESSLDTTELVHEAYLRLVGARHVDLPDRASLDRELARVAKQEATRHDRLADVIESTTVRGIFELTHSFDFSTDEAVARGRP